MEKKAEDYYAQSRGEMLPFVPASAKCILEVGCGRGGFGRLLRTGERELWGLDINPEVEAEAAQVYDRVMIGSVDELAGRLPAGRFDCIVCNDVLEHLLWPGRVLERLRTLLAPGGVVVASPPNIRYIDVFVKEMLWQKDFRYRPEGGVLDDTHFRFFTSKSMLRLFDEAGYRVLRHTGVRPCKSWKEKLLIACSCGLLSDCRYRCFATVACPK